MRNSSSAIRLPVLALVAAVTLTACSDDDVKKQPDLSTDRSVSPDVAADTTVADQAQSDQAADTPAADQTLDLPPDKALKSDTPPDLGPTKDTGPSKDSGPSDGGKACGGVSYEGCCDGATLKYCDSGKLETLDCTSSPKCGWDSMVKYYDCGTSGGSDPSGKNPKACKASADGGTKDSGPSPDGASDGATKDAGPAPDGAAKDGAPVAQGVVITEMMINSKVAADSNGEWFELYHAGTAAVNLHGWTITDKPGSSQNKHTISATGGKLMIQPGKYLVLGKSTDTTSNGNVSVAYAYGKSTWDLGNSGDEIYLYDAAKKLVDKVAYTSSWTIPNGATLSLKDPSLDNSNSKNWCAEKTKWCSTCDMGTPGKKAGCK